MKNDCPKRNRFYKYFTEGDDCGTEFNSICSDCDEYGWAFLFDKHGGSKALKESKECKIDGCFEGANKRLM